MDFVEIYKPLIKKGILDEFDEEILDEKSIRIVEAVKKVRAKHPNKPAKTFERLLKIKLAESLLEAMVSIKSPEDQLNFLLFVHENQPGVVTRKDLEEVHCAQD